MSKKFYSTTLQNIGDFFLRFKIFYNQKNYTKELMKKSRRCLSE